MKSKFGFTEGEIAYYKGMKGKITKIYDNGGVDFYYLEGYKGLHTYLGATIIGHFAGINKELKKTLSNKLKAL
jgi:hypothetical protein